MTKRHQQILDLLLRRGRLEVDSLAATFNVTTMTIRRDLTTLEKQGKLMRTHGGCVLRGQQVAELPFGEKQQINRLVKEAIARAVVSHVTDGANLYLDTGTTCEMIAQLLGQHRRDLRVFTNSLPAALALFGQDSIDVIVLGGHLGSRSPDLTGDLALSRVQDLRLDVAIVGGDALDTSSGQFYSADLATAALSQAAQRQADQVLVCIDSSKFDKCSLAVAGRLEGKTTLYTDRPLALPLEQSPDFETANLIVVSHETNPAGPAAGPNPTQGE